MKPRRRVAVYVVRRHADGHQLLVFDHVPDDSGTQVPAGGVLPGEPFIDAAVREVREETGVDCEPVRSLGTIDSPHPDEGYPRSTEYWLALTVDARGSWRHQVNSDDGDHGMAFDCWFADLPLGLGLADDQRQLIPVLLANL